MVVSIRRRPRSWSLTSGQLSDGLLRLLGHTGQPVPKRMGLAISGGVDSMALAALCSNLKSAPLESVPQAVRHVQFQAFVVDHGARPESNEEALAVSRILKSRDIPTRILSIKWPAGVEPSKLPNFESLARKFRFQVLGKACQQMKVKHLLMAHHADDQMESVFMRILDGHRGRGLRGMKGSSSIPECYGLHGVSRSGGIDELAQKSPLISKRATLNNDTELAIFAKEWNMLWETSESKHRASATPMEIEHGGIQILRPLMAYSKQSLQRTCEQLSMTWFEDATNSDPTITTRNAIRHVLAKYSLPKAFEQSRLLRLSSRERGYAFHLERLVKKYKDAWARVLEPRTGTLLVRFQNLRLRDKSIQPMLMHESESLAGWGKSSHQNMQMLSLLIVRDIVSCVSPSEQVELKSLINASMVLFPSLRYDHNEQSGQYSSTDPSTTKPFTVGGVLFTRRAASLSFKSIESITNPFEDFEWLITRQPFFSDPSKQPQIEIPCPGPEIPSPQLAKHRFSLWDGRYWIRTRNMTSRPLYIRAFRPSDLAPLQSNMDRVEKSRFIKLLKTLAPHHVRWTLPAIVTVDDTVLALPSLGVEAPGSDCLVEYEIRYKEIPAYVREEYKKSYERGFDDAMLQGVGSGN